MDRHLPARTVYLAMTAVDGVLFRTITVIFSVFLILRIGLDPFQLVLMGTILEGTYLLFEVPTGIVADTVGRRASVIIGYAGSGAAFARGLLTRRARGPQPAMQMSVASTIMDYHQARSLLAGIV